MGGRSQVRLFALMLALYALATIAYVLMPGGMLGPAESAAPPPTSIPLWQLALANGALVLVGYGAIGCAGLWLANRAGLPGAFRPGDSPRERFSAPFGLGLIIGIVLVAFDLLVQATGVPGFPHPAFPASLLASFTAGVGEEMLFRLFLMSLWAVFFGFALRRLAPGHKTRELSLWLANGVAALAFALGHLGSAVTLAGVATPASLPPLMLVEMVALNGLLGVVAGRTFIRSGLIAAAGVHFWADVVWHVIFGGLV